MVGVEELLQSLQGVSDAALEAAQQSRQAASRSQRAVELLEAAERDVVEASLAATRQGAVIGLPVGRWEADELGVHDTINVGEAVGLTPYMPRRHDADLRLALADVTQARMVTVVGTSCTGKTRTCVEAVRATLPAWTLVKPIDVDELTRLLRAGIPAGTVVWLDELQNFLTAAAVHVARGIRRLLADPRTPPIVFLGTIWPDNLTALEARPSANQAAVGRGDISTLLGETKHDRISVPDAFGAHDLKVVGDDRRVQTAINHAIDGQVTQVLAGGTQLVDRVNDPNMPGAYSPTARAVILAAADLRRVGHPDPLPRWAIVGAAPGYLDPTDARWVKSLTWAEESLNNLLDEALAQQSGQRDLHHSGVPAVRPAIQQGYVELHDYLVQHHLRVRRHHPTSERLWNTLTDTDNLAKLNEHAATLGRSAELRGLIPEAAALLRVAADAGDHDADQHLFELLIGRGDVAALAELRGRAGTDREAEELLAVLLARQGDAEAVAELRKRADVSGDTYAEASLWGLLAKRGDAEALADLRAVADSGDRYANQVLADLLLERGDAEALAELRMLAADSPSYNQRLLAMFLVQREDAEAVTELRALAGKGDEFAEAVLLGLLARRGDPEALAELRARADAGVGLAQESLAELLETRGDGEAVAELRRCVHAGYERAAEALIAVYRLRGGADCDLNVNADPRSHTQPGRRIK